MKVLVVDDASFIRKQLINYLTQVSSNMEIVEARNGAEAIAQAMATQPDVIIMDINMPVLDGIDATRTIKATMKDAKIVICSCLGRKKNVVEAILAGASEYIVKPIDFNRLKQAVTGTKFRTTYLD
ncbi:MAG: response regulator [Bacillota bacterium]|nr:response regulator [Bacillota bacterium]